MVVPKGCNRWHLYEWELSKFRSGVSLAVTANGAQSLEGASGAGTGTVRALLAVCQDSARDRILARRDMERAWLEGGHETSV